MSLNSVSIVKDLTDLDFEKLVVVVLRQGSLQQRPESHGDCSMCAKSAEDEVEESKSRKQMVDDTKNSNNKTNKSLPHTCLVWCKRSTIGEVMS
jgi:hypothetical protein